MKNMSNKKVLTIGLIIIAVCLLISGIVMVTNRTTKREPTEAEIRSAAAYAVDWSGVSSDGVGEKAAILSLCRYQQKKTIGQNEYDIYTSETLQDYLYNCGEIKEIGALSDMLYIQYTDRDGNTVTLGYAEEGLVEMVIYFLETDTLYYQLEDVTEVWEKFRGGIQFGA